MSISVALCTYNGSKHLSDQIDSILNQDGYFPYEIIVCDDASTDETFLILENYKVKYPNVFKIYKNNTNLGSTKNFEKAIKLCSGDFIFLADQDDIWKPSKIKETLEVFRKNPNAEGVFSNADLIDDEDNIIGSYTIWDSIFFLEKEMTKPIDFFDVISKNGNVVTGATLCIKKEIKSFIFPFSKSTHHDEWIANLLAIRKSLYYSTENLISYRIHENQQVGMKNLYKIVKKINKKRVILKLKKPRNFEEYRFLQKKNYLKIKKIKQLRYETSLETNWDDLLHKNKSFLANLEHRMKLKFPIQYQISKIIDNVLGKRQK